MHKYHPDVVTELLRVSNVQCLDVACPSFAYSVLAPTIAFEIAVMQNGPRPPILKPISADLLRISRRRNLRITRRPSLYTIHRVFVFLITFALAAAVASVHFDHPVDASMAAYSGGTYIDIDCKLASHRSFQDSYHHESHQID